MRSTIQDNGQLNSNASEVCVCGPVTNVWMSDNVVVAYSASNALETATASSEIRLFGNNAILGGDTGAGSIFTVQLR
jgi:hypothetical protein